MKTLELPKLTLKQLTEKFATIAAEMGDAMLVWDTPSFNRLFPRLIEVEQELKGRSGDQRTELLSLLGHSNISVRLQAASATLAVAPQAARHTLESIAASGDMPFAGEAASRIGNIDSGFFKPT